MAFDFFGQESLEQNKGINVDDYLNFKPTLLDGTQLKDNGYKPFTPDEIMQSARTHQPIQRNSFSNPFSLGSNLGNALSFNGINLADAQKAVELDNPEMAKPVKSRFEQIADYVSQNVAPPQQEKYLGAKAVEGNFRSLNLNNMNQNLTRYEMSGSDVNKIPFNPYRDNEKLYKERMSVWQDTKRAFGGLWMTAKLGFTDSLYIGNPIDTDAASVFEAANKLGGSSKEGFVGTMNNLWISAGYTAGILVEIGAEGALMMGAEALAGLGTPVTGGASIAAGIGAGTVMAADIAKKGSNLLKAIKSLSKSQTWKNMGKSAVSALNPLDDVMKFKKSTELGGVLSGASKLQKSVGYATSAWRGYNKIKFAYEEAAMEAGTTFMETKDQAINEFYAENGRMPSFEELDKIMDLSKAMSYNTFKANLPLIYISNAFVFDDLLRPKKFAFKKGIGKAAGSKDEILFRRGVMENGKKGWIAEKVPSDFWGKVKLGWKDKKLGAKMLTQGAKEYTAENTVEGLQEVFQDLFQNASQAQFNDIYNGNEGNGSYYNYLLSNSGSMFTSQGLESFMSGFLMQMMVSPVAKLSAWASGNKEAIKKGFIAGTIAKPIEFIGDKVRSMTNKDIKAAGGIEQYKAQQKQKEKEEWEKMHPGETYVDVDSTLDDDVKLLNDYFQDPIKYANPLFNRAMMNKNYDEYMNRMKLEGDKMGFIDTRSEEQFNNIMTILNYGGFEKFNEVLDDLLVNTTKEEFDKNDYGITYDDYLANVELTRQYAKDLQTKKDNLDQMFENPFHLEYYKSKENTPEYQEAALGWIAYETAKRDILFQQKQVEDAVLRAQKMTDKLGKVFETTKIPFQEVKLLLSNSGDLSRNDMLDRIAELTEEIESMKNEFGTNLDPLVQAQLDYRKDLLDVLTNIHSEVSKQSAQKLSGKEDLTELQKQVKKYIDLLSRNYHTTPFSTLDADSSIEAIANDMVDARNLGQRAQMASWSVNKLLDPKGFAENYEMHKKWITDAHKNREEEIRKALKAFRNAMNYDEMMVELHKLGVFFRPEDKDKLVNENKIPTLYQFLNNGESFVDEVDITSETYQRAIETIMQYFPNARGAKIHKGERHGEINSTKLEDSRTLKDIIKEYDFDLTKGSQTVKLSDLLNKIISGDNDERKKSLARALLSIAGDSDIAISKNLQSAIHYNPDENVLMIDPRYASSEYVNAYMNFEDLVLRAALSRAISEYAKNNPEILNKLEERRKEFLEFVDKNKETYPGLLSLTNVNTPIEFVSKALTDSRMQLLLNDIKSKNTETGKPSTYWKDVIDLSKVLFGDNGNSVLNAIELNLSAIFPEEVLGTQKEENENITAEELKEKDPEAYNALDEKEQEESEYDEEEQNEQDKENEEQRIEDKKNNRVQKQLDKIEDDPVVDEIVNGKDTESEKSKHISDRLYLDELIDDDSIFQLANKKINSLLSRDKAKLKQWSEVQKIGINSGIKGKQLYNAIYIMSDEFNYDISSPTVNLVDLIKAFVVLKEYFSNNKVTSEIKNSTINQLNEILGEGNEVSQRLEEIEIDDDLSDSNKIENKRLNKGDVVSYEDRTCEVQSVEDNKVTLADVNSSEIFVVDLEKIDNFENASVSDEQINEITNEEAKEVVIENYNAEEESGEVEFNYDDYQFASKYMEGVDKYNGKNGNVHYEISTIDGLKNLIKRNEVKIEGIETADEIDDDFNLDLLVPVSPAKDSKPEIFQIEYIGC